MTRPAPPRHFTAAAAALSTAVLVFPADASAQMAAGARSVGMGGGGMVFVTGVDAVEWNPANLGWADGWNVSLAEIGVSGLGDGATLDDFRAIVEGGDDAQSAVDAIPDTGLRIIGVTEGFATAFGAEQIDAPTPGSPLPTVGVAFGPVAFRVRSRVLSQATLSRELADLFGNGFEEENLPNYRVGNTGWRTTSFTEYTVSYGTTVGALSIGVGGRYVQGHGLLDGRFFEPVIDLNEQSFVIQSVSVQSESGTGYGFDLGLSLDLPGGFRAAASGTNVWQRMEWDENLVAWTAEFTEEDFDENFDESLGVEEFFDRFQDEPVDPDGVGLAVSEAGGDLFEQSYFPQVYRGGVGWRSSSGATTLEAVGIVVSPRGRFSSPWDERISFGVEQKVPILTLRGGYAFAQDGLTTYTAGVALRLGPVHIETSAGRFGGDGELGSRDGVYATFGVQLKGGGL